MKEKIFKKIKINGVTLKNRFVVSPMCQYSSSNGSPVNWHYKHLKSLGNSGAGLLMIGLLLVIMVLITMDHMICMSKEPVCYTHYELSSTTISNGGRCLEQ